MNNDMEHLFMCWLVICIPSLVQCLFKSSAQFVLCSLSFYNWLVKSFFLPSIELFVFVHNNSPTLFFFNLLWLSQVLCIVTKFKNQLFNFYQKQKILLEFWLDLSLQIGLGRTKILTMLGLLIPKNNTFLSLF